MLDVEVRGMNDMTNILKNFPIKLRKQALATAMRAGANVIRDEAKHNLLANGSVDTGNLVDSIVAQRRRTKDKNLVWFSVMPKGTLMKTKTYKAKDGSKTKVKGLVASGYYGHMVELGTSSTPAKPFLRPAESKSEEAYSAIKKHLSKKVDKLLKAM